MNHLKILWDYTTALQLVFIAFVSVFTVIELVRWIKNPVINPIFVTCFAFRSVLMIVVFACISVSWIMIFSLPSIAFICSRIGSLYVDNNNPTKIKTLGVIVPRNILLQIVLWGIIDMLAYIFWMFLIPSILSQFWHDTIVFKKIF